MSSGTQTDLDWTGIDAGNGASGAAIPGGTNGGGAGEKYSEFASMTDEEILGIDPPSPNGGFGGLAHRTGTFEAGAQRNDNSQSGTAQRGELAAGQTGLATPMPEWLQALVGDPRHGAEAQQLWQEHQAFRAAFSSADEARIVSSEARALRELLPGGAQEVQALRQIAQEVDSLRLVAQEAESLRRNAESVREATQSVERIDAAIFSGDPRAQSEVVAEIARANPAAFRSMFAEAAKVLARMGSGGREAGDTLQGNGVANGTGRGESDAISEGRPSPRSGSGQVLRKDGEGWGAQNSNQNQNQNSNQNQNRYIDGQNPAGPGRGFDESTDARVQGERITNPASQSVRTHQSPFAGAQSKPATARPSEEHRASQSPVTNHQSTNFDPAAYASFERATNDVVARDVRGSISDTLARVLPDGVADGAAKRIGEDIFNEVHRALAADKMLSEQVGEVLRDRRFGNAEQQRVASLLAGRAKQLVPSVARRVIAEWTSSVLGTARTRAARQAAAASRVDIAAPGGSLDSTPLRAMSAREVDYASMSDDEILGM
jgi:hypothetical protein